MKAIWMKKGIMTLMAAAVTMSPEQTASEPDHWEYEVSQDFTVTSYMVRRVVLIRNIQVEKVAWSICRSAFTEMTG